MALNILTHTFKCLPCNHVFAIDTEYYRDTFEITKIDTEYFRKNFIMTKLILNTIRILLKSQIFVLNIYYRYTFAITNIDTDTEYYRNNLKITQFDNTKGYF